MKILHLLNTRQFSGAENVVCQIMGMFRSDPKMEMVYCSPDGPIRQTLKERHLSFAPLGDMNVKELKRVIRTFQPDVIHAHDMRASFTAARACGKIPLISHIHNNAFDARGFSLKSVAYLLAARKATHIFWVSETARAGYRYAKAVCEKSTVLPNIISLDDLYEKAASDPQTYTCDVVYLGRLSYEKDPLRMMAVFEQAVKRIPDAILGVVGSGDFETELKKYVRQHGLENNVIFWGYMNNPLKLLQCAKVMIMTSRWEGTPMCALEAQALGVPLVSTPTDGIAALIENGQNGFLSEEDAVLTDGICTLLQDEETYRRMHHAQIQKAKVYNDIIPYMQTIRDAYIRAFKSR